MFKNKLEDYVLVFLNLILLIYIEYSIDLV